MTLAFLKIYLKDFLRLSNCYAMDTSTIYNRIFIFFHNDQFLFRKCADFLFTFVHQSGCWVALVKNSKSGFASLFQTSRCRLSKKQISCTCNALQKKTFPPLPNFPHILVKFTINSPLIFLSFLCGQLHSFLTNSFFQWLFIWKGSVTHRFLSGNIRFLQFSKKSSIFNLKFKNQHFKDGLKPWIKKSPWMLHCIETILAEITFVGISRIKSF